MKKRILFTFVLVPALLLSFGSAAFADIAAEVSDITYNAVINEFDSVYYNDGETVFNNYGTVYNNSGTVYNNAGIVFNNGGTVYNNGGKVFNNAGTVYNNGGEVLGEDENCIVYEAGAVVPSEAEPVQESEEIPVEAEPAPETVPDEEVPEEEPAVETEEGKNTPDDRFKISLAGDYGSFAYLEGADRQGGDYLMGADDELIITAKPGFTLTNSSSTTGRCTLLEDGSIVFSAPERDGVLTLVFKVDAPVISPAFGTYGETQSVKIIVPNGVTVYYTTDGSVQVDESCEVYEEPFEITSSTALQIMAAAEGAESSRVSGRYLIPLIDSPHFDPVRKGYASVKPQALVVTNNGIDRLKIDSVKLTGADAKCFVLNTEAGKRVEPGQSDRNTWTVAPKDGLSSSTYHAAAEFTFDNGSTKSVDITFTVT